LLGAIGRAVARYTRWLHTRWPAGHVERLPELRDDLRSSLPGVYVVGDLTGIPLLKFSADTAARAVRTIAADPAFAAERQRKPDGVRDLVIVGGGVGGMSAALEAARLGLDHVIFESKRRFQTIADFPRGKPIYTYPTDFEPSGELSFRADVKEDLLEELHAQTADVEVHEAHVGSLRRRGGLLEVGLGGGEAVRALRVVVAIGRSGNFRKLGVPGEDRDKVYNRLHDPQDFGDRHALVVGGGDSAAETAIALAQCGADVTLSYRGTELTRPKPDNVEKLLALSDDPAADVGVEEPVSERVSTASGPFLERRPGRLRLALGTEVGEIREHEVTLRARDGDETTLPNDVVFSMIGREAPLDFFRRAGIKLRGETRGLEWLWVIGFFVAVFLFYDWKNDGFLCQFFLGLRDESVFPQNVPGLIASLGGWWTAQVDDRSTLIGTLAVSMKGRSFYYTLLYTLAVGGFGLARIRRRRTPYVTVQTTSLFLIQAFPLFLLPELLLPWLGYNGVFDAGAGGALADALFEKYIPAEAYMAGEWPDWGHPRAYWRAYGFILAWPLMIYNVFTHQPIAAWLVLSFVQTFVIIPLLVWRFGKGAYCGWICSCGGLAETMGDTLRHKMPHGPRWNRLNMVGQALLAVAFALLAIRVLGWLRPESWMNTSFDLLAEGKNADGTTVNPLSWKWTVDVIVAGVLGVGLYVKYSGRVWCRFACPLAALMHVYARFSRFRILSDKKKCISCNVCTSVCHQGIDIMNFANKGLPMEDPQCVRCSACVQSCPTGVLGFGQVDRSGALISVDSLRASPVQMHESTDP
jgi:thioredoxin reductase/ferredoxin